MQVNAGIEQIYLEQKNALTRRMPALDGLRAFAILYVLWHNCASGSYHGGAIAKLINLLSTAGWLGVQLFFVLSGFLITGLLLDNRDDPQRFRNFYGRRVLRIFPPYYLLLFVICVALPLLYPAAESLRGQGIRSLWCALFFNNWTSPFIGEHPVLPHLWSLAVEEQFYLIWPACVFLLPKRCLPWLCAAAIGSALCTRFYFSLEYSAFATDAAYRFTVARWDALAMGAALAFFMRSPSTLPHVHKNMRVIFYLSAIYVVGFCMVFRNFASTGDELKWLNQSMAALLFSACVFYAVQINNLRAQQWQRLLLNPILQSIGKYSYAMYLYHLPLRELLLPWWNNYAKEFTERSEGWSMTFFTALVLLCTYCLAAISWRVLEQPILKLKRYFVSAAASVR